LSSIAKRQIRLKWVIDMKLANITKSKGKSLYGQFLTMTLLPLIVSGIVMILVASYSMKINIQREAENGLKSVAESVLTYYDCTYPGEYEAVLENDEVVLHKGGALISNDTDFVDMIKDKRGLEISILMMDTRLITTLTDSKGVRAERTVVADMILKEVYETVTPKFYNNVEIEGNIYYAYYQPIMSLDGSKCLGMIGVAAPASHVKTNIDRSIWQNVIIMGLAILITATCIVMFANQIVLMIKYMMDFMKKLAANKLDASINESVTHRDDELGIMARTLVDLQISLRHLIERDALTGLYNRRSAERKIDDIEKSGVKYCVSIGDIDHFKKFNDSFGHECGDVVLKEVAALLNENMNNKGFVARWGGEEFLLVFENLDLEDSYAALMGIREELHDKVVAYENQNHKVTMTFGVSQKEENIPINQLICMADDKLYEGKKGGRDRVIR